VITPTRTSRPNLRPPARIQQQGIFEALNNFFNLRESDPFLAQSWLQTAQFFSDLKGLNTGCTHHSGIPERRSGRRS
jgi:hypothetical protein